ncbi:hypothetical protein K501DRAFT_330375 [Backusella circina FSU 941]|nr:hypothetical protein K501DRAFT_330375 [Backusella circina FSU 941]
MIPIKFDKKPLVVSLLLSHLVPLSCFSVVYFRLNRTTESAYECFRSRLSGQYQHLPVILLMSMYPQKKPLWDHYFDTQSLIFWLMFLRHIILPDHIKKILKTVHTIWYFHWRFVYDHHDTRITAMQD